MQGGMMSFTDQSTQWAILTLTIVSVVIGLILIYLGYMVLTELKSTNRYLERIEKLLQTVE